MLPHLLLLLSILGPGNSLQFWGTREHRTKEASGPVHLRERRQADIDDDYEESDYISVDTDPPEILENVTNIVAARPEPLTTTAMQWVSGTSESATAQATVTGPAGSDAGGLAVRMLSTESATELKPTTMEMTTQPAATEAETTQPAATEAETTQPAATEAETTQPAATEAETTQLASTEAETTQPAATEAETTQTEPTEAETTQLAPTEAETTQPAPTEAETTQTASTEAETTQFPMSQVVKSQFTESTTTEAPSTEPTAMETMSTETMSMEPTDSPVFLGPSVTHKNSDVATSHSNNNGLKNGLFLTPRSSLATTPGSSDLIPVKQCLLAILILASLATIFLVCTVVLAVRLSRKNHMYPVRNYSPPEMICISSLLPEGGEGAPVTANGNLPKVQDLKTEPSEDRDGDDLPLRSFHP